MKASEIERSVGEMTFSLGDLMGRAESQGASDIPTCPGIYVVHLPDGLAPSFTAEAGQARHAKPAALDFLQDKWWRVTAKRPTDILYIGYSSNLRRRVRNWPASAWGVSSNTQEASGCGRWSRSPKRRF